MQHRSLPVFVFVLVLLLACGSASAQKYEFSLSGGGYFPAGTNADTSSVAGAVEGTFAGRIFSVPLASVYFEVPVARTYDVGLSGSRGNYVGTFVTPGLKLKLAPRFFASPYFVAGVGVAHLSSSGSVGSHSDTSSALAFGGGLDVKILPFVSLRGEARNINSGGLEFAVPGASGRQNNVLVTGGVVLRF